MKTNQILPSVLILIDIVAGIVYGLDGDYRRLIYWISAGILTASVTF